MYLSIKLILVKIRIPQAAITTLCALIVRMAKLGMTTEAHNCCAKEGHTIFYYYGLHSHIQAHNHTYLKERTKSIHCLLARLCMNKGTAYNGHCTKVKQTILSLYTCIHTVTYFLLWSRVHYHDHG